MYLLAPTAMRIAPAGMAARVRAQFGDELRRAGGFAQLSLLGAQACIESSKHDGPLAMLWASERGALQETRDALGDDLASGEAVMPFVFIATQPHLAGALLAQRKNAVSRAQHVHLPSAGWPWLLTIAQAWLSENPNENERALIGWVEESREESTDHHSDWCLLSASPVANAIRCEALHEIGAATEATSEDWLSRIVAWQASSQSAPLDLRGGDKAWRFLSERK